jgi:hypothetical protein
MNLGSFANVSQTVRRFEQVDESELAQVVQEREKKIVVT